jgi:Uma2 family endonuclease
MFGLTSKKEDFVGKQIYSIEKYLTIETGTVEKYEFWDGFVYKLDEPDDFVGSFLKLEKNLSEKLENEGYKVISNFLSKKKKLWIEAENCLFFPDLFVVSNNEKCNYENREDIISNPLMVVEVSNNYSMSDDRDQTFLTDRTEKFWKYQKIPSLKEYVLIVDEVIETYNRLDEPFWKYQSFFKGHKELVCFESVGVTFPVTEFYL